MKWLSGLLLLASCHCEECKILQVTNVPGFGTHEDRFYFGQFCGKELSDLKAFYPYRIDTGNVTVIQYLRCE